MPSYDLKRESSNVFKVNMNYKAGWEQWFLLASDVHFDNPDCDRKLFKEHLEEAKKRDAGILINGDFFCLMEGRSDPRNSKHIRKEHLGINYLDNVVEEAAEFLEPYSDRIVMIGMGNHETAILKRSETNVTERLCGLLKYKTKNPIYNGQYGGYVRFMFSSKTSGGFYGGRQSLILHYYHGTGGASLMTKGVNKHMQRLTFVPDADMIWMGHSHNEFVVSHQRMRLSQKGKVYQDECLLINTSTYKNEYKDGGLGWAIQSGHPPKPKGAYWLRFYYKSNRKNGDDDRRLIHSEILRAK